MLNTRRGGLCVDGLVENEGIIDTNFLFQKQILHLQGREKMILSNSILLLISISVVMQSQDCVFFYYMERGKQIWGRMLCFLYFSIE